MARILSLVCRCHSWLVFTYWLSDYSISDRGHTSCKVWDPTRAGANGTTPLRFPMTIHLPRLNRVAEAAKVMVLVQFPFWPYFVPTG
jgi:hypothetical protein